MGLEIACNDLRLLDTLLGDVRALQRLWTFCLRQLDLVDKSGAPTYSPIAPSLTL